jgi:hypothetical protein
MKEVHINYSGMNLDYKVASGLAASLATKELDLSEPVMVAWHDKKDSRMSPVIEGGDINTRWHDYGESHGGKLEVDINGEYDFIFADSSAFEPYGPSPLISLHDNHGNEYLCQINALRDPHNPSMEACVALDDWTSKLT